MNTDLELLSTLLGRKVTLDDLPELTKSFGIPSSAKPIKTTTSTTTTTQKSTLSPNDISHGQQDIASVNTDLELLSSILGRKVTLADLPELNKSFGIPSPPKSTVPKASQNEVIDSVHPGSDKTRVKSEIDSGPPKIKPETFDTYGKTDDALLATLLKQNGIGPANNNIPVQLLLHQVMGAASTPFSRSTDTTLKPSTNAPPARRPRPLIDGLSWLWRTWQETAPRKKRPTDLSLGGPDSEFSAEEYNGDGSAVSE